MGTAALPKRYRKVKIDKNNPKVDYGLLKSMIRDEVDLQVKRQIREIIQPLYKIIMSDDRYVTSMPELPEWLQQLAEEGDTPEEDVPFFLRDNEDPWR